jgi:hypothetical protein
MEELDVRKLGGFGGRKIFIWVTLSSYLIANKNKLGIIRMLM